ncbi:MAG: dipeptidase [Ignavibacteriaceae bacterium]|jgi:membrane dipeptidase
MIYFKYFLSLLISLIFYGCTQTADEEQKSDEDLKIRAKELAINFMIIDTHVDVPYRLEEKWEDVSEKTEEGHFDYPRAVIGGLNVPFMSIYVPAKYEETGGGKELTNKLIEMVEGIAANAPDKFSMAYSVADVTDNFKRGIISFPMGMENGTPVEGDLHNLQYFYNRGIRYITLVHSKNNHICDSSYDDEPQWNGLSPFGKEVVKEMNRLGIIVDVSHITDSSFYDVIDNSIAPVIASHSSCRHFTPGWERNISDDLIKTLAENDGVIMINFGSSFIDGKVREENSKHWGNIDSILATYNLSFGDKESNKIIEDYFSNVEVMEVNVSQVADHIDHVVELVGIDYVGFGSDFDGVRFLPEDLSDVSMFPNLIYHLLKRGYSEEDIEKICSGNFLRVWKEVEETAKRLQHIEE